MQRKKERQHTAHDGTLGSVEQGLLLALEGREDSLEGAEIFLDQE